MKRELENIANQIIQLENNLREGEDNPDIFKQMDSLVSTLNIEEILEIDEYIYQKLIDKK